LQRPFRPLRGERTRHSGHGLGLAIVAAVAGAHDAGLSVRARPAGGPGRHGHVPALTRRVPC